VEVPPWIFRAFPGTPWIFWVESPGVRAGEQAPPAGRVVMARCDGCDREAPCVSTVGMVEAGWRVVGRVDNSRWLCPDCLEVERVAARVRADLAKENADQGQ
jgi:hypothetical protein